jgi:hypothetical protein
MGKGRDIVSDHAVVRYLERVYGVDVSGLKKRLERITQEGRAEKAGAVVADGVRYALSKTGRVVTVHGANGPMAKRARRWKRRHQ